MKNQFNTVALALSALSALAGTAMGQTDRSLTTPTGWIWATGATPANLATWVGDGFRPFDLNRNSSSSFDTIMVYNSGAYAKSGWSYYTGITPAALSTALSNNNQRLLNLEPYDNGADVAFSAVAISNTGADAAGWGWLYNQTPAQISNWINNNPTPLRIVDLNSYVLNGTRLYSAVAINNTGANAQSWWYYFDQTTSDITTHLTANNARIIDLEMTQAPTSTTAARFAVVMVANQGQGWWWYPSLDGATVGDKCDLNAARLIELERFTDANGSTRFASVMIDNANTLTRSVRDVIYAGLSDGQGGGYMKEVGGGEYCAIGADHVFEPASMLKILYGAYAIDRCASGLDNLANSVFVGDRCNNNECPDAVQCNPGSESLSAALREMLEQSDNNRTKVIHDRYGRTNLNNYAHNLGMTKTNINHDIGCGSPANQLTLRDAALLYERIADGTLFSQTWQDTLYDLMIDNLGNQGSFNTEINGQAAGLALTSTELSQFKTLCYMASKGGSYGVSAGQHRTTGGWMRLPFKNSQGVITYHEYAITSFTNNVTSATQAGNTNSSIWWTMARDRIRAALVSWDNSCTPPVINNQPDTITRPTGASANFFVGYTGTSIGATYIWRRNGAIVSNGAGPGGSTISGATTASLTISSLSAANAGNYQVFISNSCGSASSSIATLTVTPPPCGSADFNGDGDIGTDADIEAFFACLGGACCRTCGTADFNGDGDVGTDADIEAFFRVLSGGAC